MKTPNIGTIGRKLSSPQTRTLTGRRFASENGAPSAVSISNLLPIPASPLECQPVCAGFQYSI